MERIRNPVKIRAGETERTFPDAGGGNLTKSDIVKALGFEPVGGQGVNLLIGTQENKINGLSGVALLDERYSTVSTEDGYGVINFNAAAANYMGVFYPTAIKEIIRDHVPETELEPGQYTFSCEVCTDTNFNNNVQVRSFKKKDNNYVNYGTIIYPQHYVAYPVATDEKWHKYRVVFEITGTESWSTDNPEGETIEDCVVCFGLIMQHREGYVKIRKAKLEHGVIVNPVWTPSPEDYIALEARIAALETKNQ